MRPSFYVTLLLVFELKLVSFGQDSSPQFYEVIRNDSIVLFFNKRNRFTEKECSDFRRYSKIDSDGNFNGEYRDFTNENTLLSKGNYDHGKKHGYFEVYHPNGNIKCRGRYTDNMPSGQWEYFYENELPERTISITDSDTLLIRFVDSKGNLRVDEGKGDFNGFVAANSGASDVITARGKIENGKPSGKWTSTVFGNTIYCKEQYQNGRLVKGVFPNSVIDGGKEYNDKAFLNTFYLPSYLNSLEEFRVEKCADSSAYLPPEYSFDIQRFSSDLRARINKVMEHDLRTGKTINYPIGDNYLTIQFAVDKEGKTGNFALLTGWGWQFFDSISSLIKTQTTFSPSDELMYFHLKLHLTEGFIYQYSFSFSDDRSFH